MSGTRGRGRKKTPTHPCWHVQRLITMAAVSTDVGLRGSCQSARVRAGRKYARTCVCVCDSVWQWSEGYLAMTAADTMGPFLYLSIQHSLSPPSHLPSCPPAPQTAATAAATPQFFPLFLASPLLLFSPFLGEPRIQLECGKTHTCCCQRAHKQQMSAEADPGNGLGSSTSAQCETSSIISVRYSSEGRKKMEWEND